MDPLTILVTGVGAPGTYGTIHALRNNKEKRKIHLIGMDINPLAVGQKIVNSFYVAPKPKASNFVDFVLDLCKKENVDVILPQVTNELPILSANKQLFEEEGIKVLVSDYSQLMLVNNKYTLMKLSSKMDVPVPQYYLARNIGELEKFSYKLGYPEDKICVKPPISRGMRGFRILSKEKPSPKTFYEEKPTLAHISLESLINMFEKNPEEYKELLVMEYLPGKEYSIDALSYNGKARVVAPRERNVIRSGISFLTTLVNNRELIDHSKKLIEALSLNYLIGFQFKEDYRGVPRLIESNPRVQGTMVATVESGANIIYDAVKIAIGEEPLSSQDNLKWGTIIARYWGWERI